MPLFELSYLAILCLVSDKLKASLLSPVELLHDPENALRIVVVVAIGLALWQDKRVRTRLLSLV